jgi:hypothetical protein
VLRDSLAGGRQDADLLMPRRDLTRVFAAPALELLRRRGAEVRLGSPVQQLARAGARWRLDSRGRREEADAVVLALPPQRAAALLATADVTNWPGSGVAALDRHGADRHRLPALPEARAPALARLRAARCARGRPLWAMGLRPRPARPGERGRAQRGGQRRRPRPVGRLGIARRIGGDTAERGPRPCRPRSPRQCSPRSAQRSSRRRGCSARRQAAAPALYLAGDAAAERVPVDAGRLGARRHRRGAGAGG